MVGSRRISPDFSSTMHVTEPRIEFNGMPASKRAKTVALNAVERIYCCGMPIENVKTSKSADGVEKITVVGAKSVWVHTDPSSFMV